jgi:6,7-dimethyl-8-ribityllumazine synthase
MGRYRSILEIETDLSGDELRIGIVMSRFNIEVSEGLLGACTAELMKRGVQESGMLLVTVPGALEIPLALQKMALTDQFDALIALGAVIANGILTTETDDQAVARMSQKGTEAAQVAIEMANLLREVEEVTQ